MAKTDIYDDSPPRGKGAFLYLTVTLAVSLALLMLSRTVPGCGEWYARHIFPVFPLLLGKLSALAPFSLFEFILLGLAGTLPPIALWKLASLILRRGRREENPRLSRVSPYRRVLCFFCLLSTLFLFFVLSCGMNYHRDTFAEQAGWETAEVTPGELRQLYRLLASLAGGLTEVLPDGGKEAAARMDGKALNEGAIRAMESLHADYPGLIGTYPGAKAVFFSEWLSRCQLSGFFSCFTMEANYNRFMPKLNMPFTVCHELAHVSGFAREDEANFIAYLACSQSPEPYFAYSANSYALRYVLSALAGGVEAEEYAALGEYLPEWIWRDMEDDRQYWAAYQGGTSEVYRKANDAFLKINDQRDGMQSYGRMLDLLLAYYRENGELARFSPEPEPLLAQAVLSAGDIHSPNALLADRETGTVLFSKASGLRVEPASVTKIMTALTALELIRDMDATVVMRREDFTDLYRRGASLSGFEVGEEVSYRDLLYTLMLVSGCDSAYALANNLCGSLPAFAEEMNGKAARLGLGDSHFVDPSGLGAPEHYTSAEDMLKIVNEALKNPVFREIAESRQYTVAPTNLEPEERVIEHFFFSRLERDFAGGRLENGGVLRGGKTGFTKAAGLCLAAWGEYDGRTYIAVIFGGPGDSRTPQYNFMDAVTLFGALEKRQYRRIGEHRF